MFSSAQMRPAHQVPRVSNSFLPAFQPARPSKKLIPIRGSKSVKVIQPNKGMNGGLNKGTKVSLNPLFDVVGTNDFSGERNTKALRKSLCFQTAAAASRDLGTAKQVHRTSFVLKPTPIQPKAERLPNGPKQPSASMQNILSAVGASSPTRQVSSIKKEADALNGKIKTFHLKPLPLMKQSHGSVLQNSAISGLVQSSTGAARYVGSGSPKPFLYRRSVNHTELKTPARVENLLSGGSSPLLPEDRLKNIINSYSTTFKVPSVNTTATSSISGEPRPKIVTSNDGVLKTRNGRSLRPINHLPKTKIEVVKKPDQKQPPSKPEQLIQLDITKLTQSPYVDIKPVNSGKDQPPTLARQSMTSSTTQLQVKRKASSMSVGTQSKSQQTRDFGTTVDEDALSDESSREFQVPDTYVLARDEPSLAMMSMRTEVVAKRKISTRPSESSPLLSRKPSETCSRLVEMPMQIPQGMLSISQRR